MSKKYVSVLKDSAATPGYRIIAPEDYVYTENGTKKVKKIDSKADKKVPATAGNLATLDSTGNLADSGKQTTDFMNALTTAYEASGSATKTVTKVTQAKTGAVTVTYSDIQSGTTSQKGLVQLEDSTSSTSVTKAATPNSVKSAYDLANGKYSKPSGGIPSSDMDSTVQASLGKADTAIQGVKLNGSTLTPSSAKVVDLGDLKTKQTAVSDPSASGTTITAIATISQDANGVITATKKTIQSASQSQDGIMSAADKTKLDGIATGAEVNQNAFSNVKVGDVTVAADAKTDTLTLAAGSNVTITPDATNDKITIAAKDTTYTADAGIRLDGTVFKHTNSVSGGTVGPTTDTAGATLSVPYVTYDSQGHVTASGTRTHNVGTASTSGAGIVQLQDSIDATTTKAATPNAVKKAIEALDVSSVGGSGKYISAISETDGKISATATTMDSTPTASSENAVTSGGVKTALDAKWGTKKLVSESSMDLNNLVDDSFYELTAPSFDNSPVSGNQLSLLVTTSRGRKFQMLMSSNSETSTTHNIRLFIRHRSVTSWGAWVELANTTDVASSIATAVAGKADKVSITGATKTKITYNSQGIVTAGADLAATDIPSLDAAKITSGTFGTARIADDAITAAKVKDNEKLPVNISGYADTRKSWEVKNELLYYTYGNTEGTARGWVKILRIERINMSAWLSVKVRGYFYNENSNYCAAEDTRLHFEMISNFHDNSFTLLLDGIPGATGMLRAVKVSDTVVELQANYASTYKKYHTYYTIEAYNSEWITVTRYSANTVATDSTPLFNTNLNKQWNAWSNYSNYLLGTELTSSDDLNNCKVAQPGGKLHYYWYSATKPSNTPTGSNSCFMECDGGVSANQTTQILHPMGNEKNTVYYWIRSYDGSSWSNWKTIYYEATSTYSPTGTQAVNGTAVASAISGKVTQFSLGSLSTTTDTYTNFASMDIANTQGNGEAQLILASGTGFGGTNMGTWHITVSNRGSTAAKPKATMTVRCMNKQSQDTPPEFGYYYDTANSLIYFGVKSPGFRGNNTITVLSSSRATLKDFGDVTTAPSGWTPVSITVYSETTHTHGNIQSGGTLQTTDVAIASGDKLVITDSSDSSKVARASIAFDGSTTTKALTQKGTWETFAKPGDLGAYLPLAGGTMTGKITAWGSKYTDDGTTGAIDMQNSNIVGLNSIYTKDASENASEGIHFYRDATHTDTLWMAGGHMYFVPNRTLAGSSASTSAADSKKVAILPASITSGHVVVTDGTSGDVKGVAASTLTVGVASKLGTADKGSSTKPIYLAAGVPTECNTYAGGTAVTLNGTSAAASTASFYAPTGAGTSNYVLKSNGSGAPTWVEKAPKASAADTAAKIATSAKIGDTNKPVYVAADGTITAISYTIATSVPSGAVFTDTKQNITLATTTKAFITGVSTTPTGTAQALTGLADTGVYLTTTAGQLHATTFDVNSKCTLQFNATTNALDFVFA